MILLEANQVLNTIAFVSLAISLNSARATQIRKMSGPKVRVVVTKPMPIRAEVVAIVGFVGRPMVGLMPWMLVSRRGFLLITPRGINQVYLVIISIGLMRLSQKTELRKCSLYSIA